MPQAGPGGGAALGPASPERYGAYARVLSALDQDLGPRPDPATAEEVAYRRHAVIETLRDLEAARSRFVLLRQTLGEGDGGPGVPGGDA